MDNRVLKYDSIKWRDCSWFQEQSLKSISAESLSKLKNSLLKNGFVAPFHVWQHDKKTYILDGCHCQKALLELENDGFTIPDELPAVFIECLNEKHAAELVIAYSSSYAEITQPGIENHIALFNLDNNYLNSFTQLDNLSLITQPDYFKTEQLETIPYKQTHVLLSFPPDRLSDIAPYLEKIQQITGVDYEQSSN